MIVNCGGSAWIVVKSIIDFSMSLLAFTYLHIQSPNSIAVAIKNVQGTLTSMQEKLENQFVWAATCYKERMTNRPVRKRSLLQNVIEL